MITKLCIYNLNNNNNSMFDTAINSKTVQTFSKMIQHFLHRCLMLTKVIFLINEMGYVEDISSKKTNTVCLCMFTNLALYDKHL